MDEVLRKIHAVAEVHTDKHFVYTGETHGASYYKYSRLLSPEHLPLLREASLHLFAGIIERTGLNAESPLIIAGAETLGAEMVRQIFYAPASEDYPFLAHRSGWHRCIFNKKQGTREFTLADLPEGDFLPGDAPIVWFDDSLNAASTLKRTRSLIETPERRIIALGVLCDRSGLSVETLQVRHVEALEIQPLERYDPEECPYCTKRRPIVLSLGYGKQFKRDHPDYPGGFVWI